MRFYKGLLASFTSLLVTRKLSSESSSFLWWYISAGAMQILVSYNLMSAREFLLVRSYAVVVCSRAAILVEK